MSHWIYNNNPLTVLPAGTVGFVYEIKNNLTGKLYIGRKYVTRKVKKRVKTLTKSAKNTHKNKVTIKESEWENYTGSCKPLIDDIALHGHPNFTFNIIAFGRTRGHVNYLEEYVQFTRNCVLSAEYYNNSIGSRRYIALHNNDELLSAIKSISIP